MAAHAYHSRGAKAVGMKTKYVRRWRDDKDQEVIRRENDADLKGIPELDEGISKV